MMNKIYTHEQLMSMGKAQLREIIKGYQRIGEYFNRENIDDLIRAYESERKNRLYLQGRVDACNPELTEVYLNAKDKIINRKSQEIEELKNKLSAIHKALS